MVSSSQIRLTRRNTKSTEATIATFGGREGYPLKDALRETSKGNRDTENTRQPRPLRGVLLTAKLGK
jgi:hypothetical protein